MSATIVDVRFAGGKKVNAAVGDYLVATDQPSKDGGDGTAPAPFELFLASIATCAGVFAVNFCQSRHIDPTRLGLRMACDWDESKKLYGRMSLHLSVPDDFPDKYRQGLVKAVELCPVKRHLSDAPEFQVVFDN